MLRSSQESVKPVYWLSPYETRRSSSRCGLVILPRRESSESLVGSSPVVVVVEVVEAAVERFDPVGQLVGAAERTSVGRWPGGARRIR